MIPPGKTLLERKTIRTRVAQLGKEIARDLGDASLCMVPVMDGGMIFAADLMREIALPMIIRPIKASSYGDATTSSGTITLPSGIPEGIEGKDLLLVDDILDTGRTLEVLTSLLREAGARSVRKCVLLRKESAKHFHADFIGFDIPDVFVVGYGLDLAGLHRNLADILVME